ncbi:MAG TPA: GntR family transcriptional regulator [Gemmatirosa sp.]|nr:GntR family transcriptional regulator [Gemmatirosa sp.]
MVVPRRPELVLTIRQRLLRALQIGTVGPGDRLPTTRALSRELHADARVVADAYRVLAEERLVELRPRSGVYVHADAARHAGATARALAAARREARQRGGARPADRMHAPADPAPPAPPQTVSGNVAPGARAAVGRATDHTVEGGASRAAARPAPSAWLADLFAAGIEHGIPAPALPRALRVALGTPPAEIAVFAGTLDQLVAICRELATWTGVRTQAVRADVLPPIGADGEWAATAGGAESAPRARQAEALLPRAAARAVRVASLFVATEGFAAPVGALAERLGRPSVVVRMRPDLYESEWAVLGAERVWLLVADARFGALVQGYLAARGATVRVELRVVGHDALDDIPAGAPVYATQAARERLSPLQLPRGLLPPVRTLTDASLLEVLHAVLEGARGRRRAGQHGSGARP